jgi:hypothetical protein
LLEANFAVLKCCPLFDELEPIMGNRPNAKPLSSNEKDSDADDEPTDCGGRQTAVAHSMNNSSDPGDLGDVTPPKKATASNTSSVSSKVLLQLVHQSVESLPRKIQHLARKEGAQLTISLQHIWKTLRGAMIASNNCAFAKWKQKRRKPLQE